jgi:hypothetical protein
VSILTPSQVLGTGYSLSSASTAASAEKGSFARAQIQVPLKILFRKSAIYVLNSGDISHRTPHNKSILRTNE